MPSLPLETILVFAPFAQLFSDRVWSMPRCWCWEPSCRRANAR